MKQLILLVIAGVLLNSCSEKLIPTTPACILKKIVEIKAQPKWNPPAEINEYEYNGKTVYLISSPCCDKYNELVDENCKYVCAPSGGYTGKGDGVCPDFEKTAKHIRLVWKDQR